MKINRFTVLNQIKKYMKPVKGSAFMLIASSMLSIPVSLISPRLFQILVDEVMTPKNFNQFYIVAIGLFFVYVLRFIADGSVLFFGNRVLNTFTFNLRKDVLQKYKKTPLAFLEKKEVGDLKMRLIDDVDCLGNFLKDQVIDYIAAILMIVLTLCLTMATNFEMTIYCLFMIPFVFLIHYLIGRGTKKVNEEIRLVNEEYYTSTHNSLQFWEEIKTQNAENAFIERFKTFRRILAKLGLRSIRYWGYAEVLNDFKANYLTRVMVYVIGSFFVLMDEISVGSLMMYAEYFALLFSALDSINSKQVALKTNTPYYKRIFETLNFPNNQSKQLKTLPRISGQIQLQNVYFEYNKNQPVLKDINLFCEFWRYRNVLKSSLSVSSKSGYADRSISLETNSFIWESGSI